MQMSDLKTEIRNSGCQKCPSSFINFLDFYTWIQSIQRSFKVNFESNFISVLPEKVKIMKKQCFESRVSETLHRRVQKSLFVPNLHRYQKYPYCVQSEKINCADSLPFLFFCLVALSSDSLGALAVTFM